MKVKVLITAGVLLALVAFTLCQGVEGAGKDTGVPAGKWMEMPADCSGTDVYTHTFTKDNETYRNYSFGWDHKNRIALWVAYPLSRFYMTGKVDRTNSWGLDPYFSDAEQPVLFRGFREYPTYDRGHQIPSGDRKCCYEANAQTFYGTNMTPQLGPNFNQGIWNALENQVRVWARKSDTLYVVTGCVIPPRPEYATDNHGKSIPVPSAYYKALLRYDSQSDPQFSAAAFWLEHKDYYDNTITKDMSLSIDELEAKTGLDLFVNLPDAVGEAAAAKIEAAVPKNSGWWWR